jgi:hypothetical protein
MHVDGAGMTCAKCGRRKGIHDGWAIGDGRAFCCG